MAHVGKTLTRAAKRYCKLRNKARERHYFRWKLTERFPQEVAHKTRYIASRKHFVILNLFPNYSALSYFKSLQDSPNIGFVFNVKNGIIVLSATAFTVKFTLTLAKYIHSDGRAESLMSQRNLSPRLESKY